MAIEAHEAFDFEIAAKYYSEYLNASPDDANTHHNYGVLLTQTKQFASAETHLTRAIEIDKTVAQYWHSYIDFVITVGQYSKALQLLDFITSKGATGEGFERLKRITLSVEKQPNQNRFLFFELIENLRNCVLNRNESKLEFSLNDFLYYLRIPEFIASISSGTKMLATSERHTLKKLQRQKKRRKLYNFCAKLQSENKLSYEVLLLKAEINLCDENFIEALIDLVYASIFNPLDHLTFFKISKIFQDLNFLSCAALFYTHAIQLKPDFVEALTNYANVTKKLKNYKRAENIYRRAIALSPKDAELRVNLGNMYLKQINFLNAEEQYLKALENDNKHERALNNLGRILVETGRVYEARQAYERALEIDPNYYAARMSLGVLLQSIGERDAACDQFRHVIKQNPSNTAALRNLVFAQTKSENEQLISKITTLYDQVSDVSPEKVDLAFALSNYYHSCKNFCKSYEFLKLGNDVERILKPYSISTDKKRFGMIKKTFEANHEVKLGFSKQEPRLIPIFIVGMPRSGTTLLEQIISSHPQVDGFGELRGVEQFGASLATQSAIWTENCLRNFREKYITSLPTISNANVHMFVDKMPHNFRYVGLLRNSFPEAKIIHIKRNPAATIWSNYKQYFTGNLRYSNDLFDTRDFYHLYRDLIKFWGKHPNINMFEIDYDELVIDFEVSVRNIITYLGIQWDDRCLEPHKNKSMVRTASTKQVRQEVYQKKFAGLARLRTFFTPQLIRNLKKRFLLGCVELLLQTCLRERHIATGLNVMS